MITYYVVQSFKRGPRGRLLPEEPRNAKDETHAKRIAQMLASSRAGVMAFSRAGDPDTGDWDDAVVVARHGEVPEEMAGA